MPIFHECVVATIIKIINFSHGPEIVGTTCEKSSGQFRYYILKLHFSKNMHNTYIFIIPSEDVHLAKAKEWQHKVSWCKLCGLIIILEGLIIVLL